MASIKKRQSMSDVFKGIASGITSIYVFFILTIFPLYTHNKYFDILTARYRLFYWTSVIFCYILFALAIMYLLLDYQNQASSPTAIKRFLLSFKFENLKKCITLTDIFFIIMFFAVLTSTIFSSHIEESLYGNAGRYQGLECWSVYFLTYFAVTRTFKFKKYQLDFAILAGAFACVWGILDFFWLDPFGFFVNVEAVQQGMFASSIGNLNTYTNYTIMIFALAGALFIVERNVFKSVFYCIITLIAACGTIFGFADNAVLGFAGFFIAMPFFVFKNRRMLLKYLIVVDLLLISMFIFKIALGFPHNTFQGSFFIDLVSKPFLAYLFIPFTILIVILYIVFIKMKPNYVDTLNGELHPLDSILPKQVLYAYMIVILVSFAIVVYILLDMNIFKQHVELWKQIPSSNQLVFNDYWGTHRGHNWRIAFINYTQNFNFFQRLFGYGPDTYLIVTERTFYEEMVTRFGEVYDSAHNEYINYLICEGLVGLVSYLGIFISGLRLAIKQIKNNVFILAPIMAVIAYLVQAFVNIAIPITTPVFFILFYICVAEHFSNREITA